MSNEAPETQVPSTSPADDAPVRSRPGASVWGLLAVGLAFGLLLATGLLALRATDDGRGSSAFEGSIDTDRYQAVYLDNERVYFGRLEQLDGEWFVLRDAFFIRTTEGEDGKEAGSEVARITEEVAEPQQDLLVRADSIDMVQNLRASSAVAEAIDDVVK